LQASKGVTPGTNHGYWQLAAHPRNARDSCGRDDAGFPFRLRRRSCKPVTGLKILMDFLIRLVSLVVAALLLVLAFRAGVQFDLLYLALLAVGASLAGEMLAIAVYAVRRVRADRTTTALRRSAPRSGPRASIR
jgi:hypothetical protein